MSYHEPRLSPGDPGPAPLAQVIVFVDDEGKAHYPGSEGYVEPEGGSAEFLADQARQLAEDQHLVESGQAQTFSPEQVANTRAEAERLTDPALEGVPEQPQQPQQPQAAAPASLQPPVDPNAAASEAREQEVREAQVRAEQAEQQVQQMPPPPDPNNPAADPNAAPQPQQTPRRRRG